MSNLNDLPTEVMPPPGDNGMRTIGYRIIGPGSGPVSNFVFEKLVTGVALEKHEPVVLRREAEAAMTGLTREVAAWKDTAAQMHRDAEFWEGLVRRIGTAVSKHDIGVHVADDGVSWNSEPLALKVVESVEKSYAPGNRFQRALRILITGK